MNSSNGSPAWHTLNADRVAKRLRVDPAAGLPDSEARRRLQTYGANELARSRRVRPITMLINQFRDVMILVLVAAAIVSGVVGELRDAIAILVIVALNAVVGVLQEYRAERALAALRELAAPSAQVRRDGAVVTVPTSQVVPGDIVVLEAGAGVPADLRLTLAEGLAADESALTSAKTRRSAIAAIWPSRGRWLRAAADWA